MSKCFALILLSSLILLSVQFTSQGRLLAASENAETAPVQVNILKDNATETRLTFEVGQYDYQSVELDIGEFDLISLSTEPTISREGFPDLPFIARSVLIPPQSDVHVQINTIESRLESGIHPVIAPHEENASFEHVGACDEYLSQDDFWPPQAVVLGEPAILRGWRLINIIFHPVQYNRSTGEMRFNDRIDLSLTYDGIGENTVESQGLVRSTFFARRALRELVENPPEFPERDDLNAASYLYLIPNVDQAEETVAPLIEWRKRQGHRVAVEILDNGASSGTISNLIEEYYESEDPVEFVAIVGDADGAIRLSAATANGDYEYTRLDGNDPLPDIAIGRISCSTIQELERVVNKLVSYESDPYMEDTDWFRRGTVVAGSSTNGLGTILLAKYVRKELLALGFDEVLDWYHNVDGNIGGDQPFLQNSVESGISILHYRAYMYMNSLNVNVLYNLRNREGRWPAVLAISCATGHFVGRDAHTEAFFKSRGGGIGAIGTSTAGTHVQYNNMMAGGVWKGIYKDELYAFGWGLNSGKYQLWQAYDGLDGTYMNFMDWNNLMGDPGTIIWTDIPQLISVDFPEQIPVGTSHFTAQVLDEENDEPLKDVLLCLWKGDELHTTSYTNEEGVAEFFIDPEALTEGEMKITATKHNVKAYLGDVEVVEEEYFLGMSEWQLDDDDDGESNGDGDNTANPNETIELTISVHNFGNQVPENAMTLSLTSVSPWAEVISDPVELDQCPEVGQGSECTFVIQVDPACPDEEMIRLRGDLSVDDMQCSSMIELPVESPRIMVQSLQFADGAFNPGDVQLLDITIRNTGHKRLQEFTATISTENVMLRTVEPSANYRSINVNQTGRVNGARFRVSAHPFIVPGMVIPIQMDIETAEGFTDRTEFDIVVGEKDEDDPLGPDSYGYICLDSGDDDWEFAPEYDWIEIDPHENQFDFQGNAINISDAGNNTDESMTIDLPFGFQYYGEVFDLITVCTNGWAAFGDQEELADFRNRRIGQALGPNAQICVWWDNLLASRTSIYWFYDEQGGRFILEWNDVQRLVEAGNGAHETFQIIFYDTEVHPTFSGDGMILFQYKDVTNQSTAAHNDTPYCTIGISNLDDSDGIEYTYWDQYPPGARQIEDEMALLFITQTDFRTGILQGTVTDFETNQPIEGVTIITSRGFWAETDGQGHYVIDNILVGENYSATASGQGWNDSSVDDIDIEEDEVVEVNFSLLHPEFSPSVDELSSNLMIGDVTELEFSVTNTGNGPLFWHAERHLRGAANAAPWELRQQIPVGEITGDGRLQGVVYCNERYYVAGSNNQAPLIYVFDLDGELIDQFSQGDGDARYGSKDLACDGEWIWGSGGAEIFALNLEGEQMRRFEGPYSPNTNLAWDTDRELLWVSSTTTDITGIDRDGNIVADVIARNGLRVYGLSYWTDDPDGYQLYVYHKNSDISNQMITKINIETNDTLHVANLEPANGGSPIGAFITNQLDIYSWVFLGLVNDSDGDRIDVYQIDGRREWFGLEPVTGLINAEESQDFTLTLDAANLPAVQFNGDLVFFHNATEGEDRIPVSLNVEAGIGQPAERRLVMDAGWSLVSLNVVPDEENIVALMRPLVENGQLIMLKNGRGEFYLPEQNFDNIETWDVLDGYQINLREAAQLRVEGVSVAPDMPIPLEEGWNMKAYLPQESIDAIVALSGIEDVLMIAKDGRGNFYLPEFGFSNMGDMTEGQGYQIKVREDAELVYNFGEQIASSRPPILSPQHFTGVTFGESNMSVLIIGDPTQAGWETAVYNAAGRLTGSGCFDADGQCGVAVWGNDITGNAEPLSFRVWDTASERTAEFQPISGKAEWTKDALAAGHLLIGSAIPIEFGIHSAYPNPFNSAVRLQFGLRESAPATLKIYDIAGRMVQSLVSGAQNAGNFTVVWNAEAYSSGLYVVRLEQAGEVASMKLMLVK